MQHPLDRLFIVLKSLKSLFQPVRSQNGVHSRSTGVLLAESFIPDYPLLELTNSLTIEAWINAASPGRGINGLSQIVFRGDDRQALDPYFLALRGTELLFAITDNDGAMSLVRAPITINNWHHVAGTLDDATGKQSLYIDGVLVAQEITFLKPMGQLTGPNPGLGIGNLESQTYDEYFDGLIAEVRISAKALMPNEFLNARPVITVTHQPLLPHETLIARQAIKATHQGPTTTEILAAQPVIIVAPPENIDGMLRINFEVADVSTTSFALLHADQLEGPWTINPEAVLITNVVNQSYSFTLPASPTSTEFYRVQTK